MTPLLHEPGRNNPAREFPRSPLPGHLPGRMGGSTETQTLPACQSGPPAPPTCVIFGGFLTIRLSRGLFLSLIIHQRSIMIRWPLRSSGSLSQPRNCHEIPQIHSLRHTRPGLNSVPPEGAGRLPGLGPHLELPSSHRWRPAPHLGNISSPHRHHPMACGPSRLRRHSSVRLRRIFTFTIFAKFLDGCFTRLLLS